MTLASLLTAPVRWPLRPLKRRHAVYIGCLTNAAIDAYPLTSQVNDLGDALEDARAQIDEHCVGGPAVRAAGQTGASHG